MITFTLLLCVLPVVAVSWPTSDQKIPTLRSATCSSNKDCPSGKGEVCRHFYEGCSVGHCVCDARYHLYANAEGQCQLERKGGDPCDASIKDHGCPSGMQCRNGTCECEHHHMRMTSDGLHCLRHYEKLIGESCKLDVDKCFQRKGNGYTHTEAYCAADGFCHCSHGYKELSPTCEKWQIGERGCKFDHQCENGALCLKGQCLCPSDYEMVARNTKCAKRGAPHDIGLGHICDEINERRYCAYGLVCHECDKANNVWKCVRVLALNGKHVNNAVRLAANSLLSLSFPIVAVLLTITSCHQLILVNR